MKKVIKRGGYAACRKKLSYINNNIYKIIMKNVIKRGGVAACRKKMS